MSSITLKKLPPRLHQAFKRRAKENRRSLQAEIVRTLEEAVGESADGVEVEAVAGMLKPGRKGVSVAAMRTELDEDLYKAYVKKGTALGLAVSSP